jgi:hypothetical protein
MADRKYSPPPAPADQSTCPKCGRKIAPHGMPPGGGGKAGDPTGPTHWRYACEGLRKAFGYRDCTYTVTLPLPVKPEARAGLAEELREMGREYEVGKGALRLAAKMIEEGVPAGLPAALPPGELPDQHRAGLTELGNHACAAGLRPEMQLLHALAERGISPATEAVMKGFRNG